MIQINSEETELIDIDQIIEYANNARTHDKKQIDQICKSIKKYGFNDPIAVDENNMIIEGHARVTAMKKLGEKKIPAFRLSHLSKEDKKAYILAHNKIALNSGWNDQLLSVEFQELHDLGFDLELTGFSPEEFSDFLIDENKDDEFEHPSKSDVTVEELDENIFGVRTGDIWKLGEHRVMCGDSTDRDTVKILMNSELADMVFTDPPYNISSHSSNFSAAQEDKWFGKSMKKLADSEWDKNFDVNKTCSIIDEFSTKNSTSYIWTSHFLINDIWENMKKSHEYVNYIVWSKTNPIPSLSKRHPAWNTELCVYASRGSKRIVNYPSEGHFLSCRTLPKKSDGTHPTQKPLDLIIPIIQFNSNIDQLVLDLFLGSGSTLIACEKSNRKCFGMEIDPHYVSVIIKRWQDFTGKLAEQVHEG